MCPGELPAQLSFIGFVGVSYPASSGEYEHLWASPCCYFEEMAAISCQKSLLLF